MAIGLPIGVCMGIVGFVGLALILPFQAAIAKMAITPYDLVSSYTFATLPLFILMGSVIFSTGQGGTLFKVARKWFGRTPGGLAMASVMACAAFGAVTASALATAATMALVALPEMKKAKYDNALANGCVAAGGPIGSLIPPSGILIIYGIITENSIAQLFVGGIIPGVLVAVTYILMIGIRCWIKPELGPPGEKVPIIDKFKSLSKCGNSSLWYCQYRGLIIGVFYSHGSGGSGCVRAFISAADRKKLTWQKAKEAS
jgi:tripartite ATP-independent transporter DctM subunit